MHKATRLAVALCDSDLIDKRFEEGKLQLDLTTSFFKGQEKSLDEVKELLDFYRKEDACFNIVGKQSCDLALEIGLFFKEDVSEIQGVPFVLVLG